MRTLIELYDYAEQNGIDVDWFPLSTAESLSMPLGEDRYAIALDPWKMRTIGNEYYKLSHEIGHCRTGSFYNRWAAYDIRQRHENRADKWAITHTISRSELSEAMEHGYTEIWSLAEHFDLPVEFMEKVVCWYLHGNLDIEHYVNF